jgi:predicted RNase H-like nuclease (RuvC/YqgF family)
MSQYSESFRHEAPAVTAMLERLMQEHEFLTAQNEAHEAEIERLRDELRVAKAQLAQLHQDKEIGEVLESE